MKNLYLLGVVFLLAGCALPVPKSMDELKTARFQQDRIVLKKNYQDLAKCWDAEAVKPNDIFGTKYLTTSAQIFPEQGLARMQTGGEGYNLYHMVLELQEKSTNETYVELYATKGTASISQKWMQVLQACADAQ